MLAIRRKREVPVRTRIFALGIVVLLSTACASNTLVGNWRMSQRYDYFHRKWEPVNHEANLEFKSDGKVKVSRNEILKEGTYTIDESVNPSRLVLTTDQGESVKSIFRLDGNTLIMKSSGTGNSDSQFPVNFDPGEDETGVDLFKSVRN
jgi:uncharacterized protein (TIGR03067 family)